MGFILGIEEEPISRLGVHLEAALHHGRVPLEHCVVGVAPDHLVKVQRPVPGRRHLLLVLNT